jgi:hypothetical protein
VLNGEAECGRKQIRVNGCQLRPGAETANKSTDSRSKTGGFPSIYFWGWCCDWGWCCG